MKRRIRMDEGVPANLHLEGKVIIITGGFKGIGKGITLQLAQEGPSRW